MDFRGSLQVFHLNADKVTIPWRLWMIHHRICDTLVTHLGILSFYTKNIKTHDFDLLKGWIRDHRARTRVHADLFLQIRVRSRLGQHFLDSSDWAMNGWHNRDKVHCPVTRWAASLSWNIEHITCTVVEIKRQILFLSDQLTAFNLTYLKSVFRSDLFGVTLHHCDQQCRVTINHSLTCCRSWLPPKMSISSLKFTLHDRNTSVLSPSWKVSFKLTSPESAISRGVLFGSAVFKTKNDRSQYRLVQLSVQPFGHSVPHGQPEISNTDDNFTIKLTIFACNIIAITIWNTSRNAAAQNNAFSEFSDQCRRFRVKIFELSKWRRKK